MASEELTEELEAVTAILDEETVDIVKDEDENPTEIIIKITPLTASEQEKQYVSLTLVVKINQGKICHYRDLVFTFSVQVTPTLLHHWGSGTPGVWRSQQSPHC